MGEGERVHLCHLHLNLLRPFVLLPFFGTTIGQNLRDTALVLVDEEQIELRRIGIRVPCFPDKRMGLLNPHSKPLNHRIEISACSR